MSEKKIYIIFWKYIYNIYYSAWNNFSYANIRVELYQTLSTHSCIFYYSRLHLKEIQRLRQYRTSRIKYSVSYKIIIFLWYNNTYYIYAALRPVACHLWLLTFMDSEILIVHYFLLTNYVYCDERVDVPLIFILPLRLTTEVK